MKPGPLSQVLFHVAGGGTFGAAALGYYGSESLTLKTDGKRPLQEADFALPRLQGVLEALLAREAALANQDLAAVTALAAPGYRDGALTPKDFPGLLQAPAFGGQPTAVSIRVDGDRSDVTFSVPDGGRPHAVSLVRVGDAWRFSSGLL